MGALTSKPYSYRARFWELSESFSFDYLDDFHSPIRGEMKGGQILRLLPDLRYSFLNEWISDRSRFSYDSISANRITNASVSFDTVIYKFNYDFSYLWINDFVSYRLGNVPLFSLNTLDSDLFVSQQTTEGLFMQYDFFSDLPSPINLDRSLLESAQNILSFGTSFRFTQPVFYTYLFQQKRFVSSLFEFGFFSSTFDYNIGSGLYALMQYIRFGSRVSTFFDKAYFVVSSDFYKYFRKFFESFPSFVLNRSAFEGYSYFRGLSFFLENNNAFILEISPHLSESSDVFFPIKHGLESDSYFFLPLTNVFVHSRAISDSGILTLFSFGSILLGLSFSGVAKFNVRMFENVFQFSSLAFSTYNFYDHYLFNKSLNNSPNILLNVHRNENHRHNHLYLL